jgi:hypothetical protein
MGQARRSYAFEKVGKFTCSRQFAGSGGVAGSWSGAERICDVAINNYFGVNKLTRAASARSYAVARKWTRYRRLSYKRKLERVCGNGICVYGAKGSWTVPTVNCSKTPSTYSSFWVGIDGYSSSTVEQTGTDSDCSGSTPRYYAWYEFYPAGSVLISSVPVSPGNKLSASVTYSGTEFTISITNVTTGKTFSKSSRVSGARRTSAEWIAEAPCCTGSGGILPLADFGTVDFGSDYTGVSGTNDATDGAISGPISEFGSSVFSITMVSSGGANEAVPSALTADGTSFDVVWESE